MKKAFKKRSAASYNQSDVSLNLLIKLTASEFGLSEEEVRACAASFIQQNKSNYPIMRNTFVTV